MTLHHDDSRELNNDVDIKGSVEQFTMSLKQNITQIVQGVNKELRYSMQNC